ncbi:MAG TPA: winged helix-turn-helix domain-containing protein [Bryobacteraceae bacterium]|jgi:DNA-binding winged helix-turn-helix (wHTH) protein/tetratricopeptide (TPR) repeat protein
MSAPAPSVRVLRFGLFELDPYACELRKCGVKVHLQGQPLQVLSILLQRAGSLVTRDELRSQLWQADIFVNFDHSLDNAIARIRDVLGDSARTPTYLETLPRRGYRFIAPVEEALPPISVENDYETAQAGVLTAPQGKRATWISTFCVCGAIGFTSWMAWQHFYVERAPSAIRSVAVRHERRRPVDSVDPKAYEAYLRGRYYLTKQFSMRQPLDTAKGYFEGSIQKDPDFAPAYAGLANSYVSLAFFRHLSPRNAYSSAKKALAKALDLDERTAAAHGTLALLEWQFEWDWAAAEREFNYTIAVAPDYDCVRADHAFYLAWSNRRDEALAEVTRSRELNPGSSFASTESAVYFQLRDYPCLIEASQKGVASDPNEWLEHYYLGVGYEASGRQTAAIAEYQKAVNMSRDDQNAMAALAHAYGTIGRRFEAEKILRDLQRKSNDKYVSPYILATIYAGLDKKDVAFKLLEKAYQERCPDLACYLKADLRIDNLRSDPRFQELLRRVGFPE